MAAQSYTKRLVLRELELRYHTQFQEGKKYEKKSFIFITVCRYDSIVCLF